MKLEDYFTDEEIIRQVCKQRIKSAEKARERQDFQRFTGKPQANVQRDLICTLLPPRKVWSRYRPKSRLHVSDANFASVVYATFDLMHSEPNALWAIALRAFIARVRYRVLFDASIAFQSPEIKWENKEENKYRPLAVFSLEDSVINSLGARYFRDFCDRAFEPTSFAFRSRTDTGMMPTHHSAFEAIYRLRTSSNTDLFVAEADIRAFYDCVGHEVALQGAKETIKRAETLQPGNTFDPRAMRLLAAYLDCYSFPRNVLEGALQRLQHNGRYPKREFPWPEEALADYYTSPRCQAIGVPQGGALSCVIANLVLDKADKDVRAVGEKSSSQVDYFRYCDDMIVLARQESDCREAFAAYLRALKELKLPYHEPARVGAYGKTFWTTKSKDTYCWTHRRGNGFVPWVQFVGYQVRYDGLVRIKAKSVRKQLRKIRDTVDHYKFGLRNAVRDGAYLAVTKDQVFQSLRWQLIYASVGKVKHRTPNRGPRTMCWAGGYRALNGKPIATAFLKQLDRFREKQIARMVAADLPYRNEERRPRPQPAGAQVSYLAQFQDRQGQELINRPGLR